VLDIDPLDSAGYEAQDLATEVDRYLAAPIVRQDIDMIAFWKVSIIFIFVIIYLNSC
jgi:hypothetical protein